LLSPTRRALEDFDNQHEFERLAADVLNAEGYSDVEPMAPRGGPDGGRDIKFRDGETEAIAFVTLEKKIRDKFTRELAKQRRGEGHIAVFCNVSVTHAVKRACSEAALNLGYTVAFYDLERLRSLLDTSLTVIRRRYLGIDDSVSARLRSDICKFLRFPDTFPDEKAALTTLERLLPDRRPRQLFDLLMTHHDNDVLEAPGIGSTLHGYMTAYYAFRQKVAAFEAEASTKIVELYRPRPAFPAPIEIHLQYCLLRFAGLSKADISGGIFFLNYGITWESAETMFGVLSADTSLSATISELLRSYEQFGAHLEEVASGV